MEETLIPKKSTGSRTLHYTLVSQTSIPAQSTLCIPPEKRRAKIKIPPLPNHKHPTNHSGNCENPPHSHHPNQPPNPIRINVSPQITTTQSAIPIPPAVPITPLQPLARVRTPEPQRRGTALHKCITQILTRQNLFIRARRNLVVDEGVAGLVRRARAEVCLGEGGAAFKGRGVVHGDVRAVEESGGEVGAVVERLADVADLEVGGWVGEVFAAGDGDGAEPFFVGSCAVVAVARKAVLCVGCSPAGDLLEGVVEVGVEVGSVVVVEGLEGGEVGVGVGGGWGRRRRLRSRSRGLKRRAQLPSDLVEKVAVCQTLPPPPTTPEPVVVELPGRASTAW